MQFIRSPDNPAPENGLVEAVSLPDGAVLRCAFFSASAPRRGCVVLLGGRVEFIEKYFEVVGELQARGLDVATLDWRGQGLSSRLLARREIGHIDAFQTYETDLRYVIERFVRPRAAPPYVLLAHSMGGAIALRALLNGLPQCAAAALSAPMTRILPHRATRWAARALAEAACALGQAATSTPDPAAFRRSPPAEDPLTHDARRSARFQALMEAAPEAVIAAPTYGWLRAAFRTTWAITRPDRLRRLATPMLIVSPRADCLVDPSSHDTLACDAPMATLQRVPGARHEILMETDAYRAAFWSAFDRFAAERKLFSP